MLKIILILFVFIAFHHEASAQVMMSLQQHEALRKDIVNYGLLIKKYEILSDDYNNIMNEFDIVKKNFSIYKEKYNNSQAENQRIEIHNLTVKAENYKLETEKLKEEIKRKDRENSYIQKSLVLYKKKYFRQKSLSRGDKIIYATIYSMFGVCTVWGIYISIDSRK